MGMNHAIGGYYVNIYLLLGIAIMFPILLTLFALLSTWNIIIWRYAKIQLRSKDLTQVNETKN